MSESDTGSTAVRPLTKRTKDKQELYVRRPEVELQVKHACSMRSGELFAEFQVKNRDAADFLFDETIVYLLREAFARDDGPEIEALYLALNVRMARYLKKFARIGNNFEDLVQSVGMTLIRKLRAPGSDAADYAEVNFAAFILSEAKTVLSGLFKDINREQANVILDAEEDNGYAAIERIDSGEMTPEGLLVLRSELRRLPRQTQQIVVLISEGWKIESKDPREPTIERALGVTSRTIRNRMKEARELLVGEGGSAR